MNSSRRQFLKRTSFTFAGVGIASLPLLRGSRAEANGQGEYTVVATYQDTKTSWFGENRDTLIVRAEDFIIGSASGLIADEGSHKHSFSVSQADMQKLKEGKTVVIVTEIAADHTHEIIIDPIKGKVPGGKIIEVKEIKRS